MFDKIKISPCCLVVICVWYVINIRVEAGMASVFERTLDGLVGGALFLFLLYLAGKFFGFLNIKDES
jgi:hypothetical protein